MHSPPAEIGCSRRGHRHAGADRRSRRVRAQPRRRWRRLRASAGVRLRPHAKTHKCPEIAKRQIARGAVGQCVQKVGGGGSARERRHPRHPRQQRDRRRVEAATPGARSPRTPRSRCASMLPSRSTRPRGWRASTASSSGRSSRSRSGWSAAASRPERRPETSPAGSRMRRICASRACRPITAAPSILPTAAERRQAIDGAIEAVRETLEALAAAGLPCRERDRRRHGHVPSRGCERRLQRAAGRLIRLHGHRLREDRRRRMAGSTASSSTASSCSPR